MQAFKFSLPDRNQQVIFSPGLWVPLASCVLVLLATLGVFYYPRMQKRWVRKKESGDGGDEEVGSLKRRRIAAGDEHVAESDVASDGNARPMGDMASSNADPVVVLHENAIPLEDLSTPNADPVGEEGNPVTAEVTTEVTVEVIPSEAVVEERSSEIIIEGPPSLPNLRNPPPPPVEVDKSINESAGPTEVVLETPSPVPNTLTNGHTPQKSLEVAVSDSQSPLPSPLPSPSLLPLELGNGKVNDMRDAASRRRRILGEGSGQGRHS